MTGACSVHFYVDDFTGEGLAESGVTVTVYEGSEKKATYTTPDGDKRWGVFTIDAQKDAATVLQSGIVKPCPYIAKSGEANWGMSFNVQGWSYVPEKSLITGLFRGPGEELQNIEMASYAEIGETVGFACMEADWTSFSGAGEVQCA